MLRRGHDQGLPRTPDLGAAGESPGEHGDHPESTGITQINPELVEMLAKHARKRQTVGLLAATAFAEPPRPEIFTAWQDADRVDSGNARSAASNRWPMFLLKR